MLEQSSTAHMPVLMTTGAFRSGRKCYRVLLSGVTCTISVPKKLTDEEV